MFDDGLAGDLDFSEYDGKARIIRGQKEKRSDEEIHAEANTEVVVPVFTGK